MKKNKKVKENFDNVVIKNVELTPTTIGKIENNEGSLKSLIIMFLCLFIIIFILPYVVNYISDFKKKENQPPIIPVEEPEKPDEEEPIEPETPENQVDFISINSPISKTISGYRYEISADLEAQKLDVKVTNVSGSAFLLINTPMYIELYSSEKTLLNRILITKREIVSESTIAFNFSYKDSIEAGQTPAYLTLETKNVNDYPAITLKSEDVNEMPFLTCTKGNETIIYSFNENDKGYLLSNIIYRILVNDTSEDVINNYEAMITSYTSIDGVDAELNTKSSGFEFESKIDLDKVTISEKKRILNNYAFYEKDTLAKTIYFELNSSGYQCK